MLPGNALTLRSRLAVLWGTAGKLLRELEDGAAWVPCIG
jgi:hypothetical protein